MLSRALYLVQPTDQRHPDENQSAARMTRSRDAGWPQSGAWRALSAEQTFTRRQIIAHRHFFRRSAGGERDRVLVRLRDAAARDEPDYQQAHRGINQ
jgi:hypothetical protein